MNVISYLVLLTVLLVVLCVIGILAITFRSCILFWCCNKSLPETESESPSGRRNNPSDEQEEVPAVRARPFSNMEQIESPPSYEEAVQQELFKFRLPTTPAQSSRPPTESSNTLENGSVPMLSSLPSTSSSALEHPGADLSLPSTSQNRHRQPRPRSSTAVSVGNPHLSTINEKEGEWPVQIVIDCIGVQAARLIENCETTLHLTDGNELKTKSKC